MKTSSQRKTTAKKTKHRLLSLAAGLLYALTAGHPVLADDTEVLIGPGGQAWAKPNILFIMDTSGSMGTEVAGTDGLSRLDVVKDVFADLMNSNSGLNVSMMRFDAGGSGGYFVTAMQELNDNNRANIIAAANALNASGNTPLSETFYEAALFWGGKSVDYGDNTRPGTNVSAVLNPDNTANYLSPISSQCQRNYTILLTDGEPVSDNQADDSIATLTGSPCDGNCLDEVAEYLYTADQNTDVPGKQTVNTYTIGFATNQTLLANTALAGGGNDNDHPHYIIANNAAQLTAAFTGILDTITDANDSFSPPALAANAFSGIAHLNRLYYALFEPAAAPKWKGNVKPYTLNDNYQLVDAAGAAAVDARGFFLENSRSLWSNNADGSSIAAGGANGRLPAAANRNLYTYTDAYSSTGVPDSSLSLLNTSNTGLTAALLELPSTLSDADAATQRSTVIDAIRNSTTIGAPLHSQPALVTYGGDDAATADLTLFVATNDGLLHALDASPSAEGTTEGGKELFAFMPKELLPNLRKLESGTGAMVYGLDGDISVWVKESADDTDLTIEATEGDHVYVYVGMRRGGNNYYALDATTRSAPTLKWVIRGGPGGTAGFEELGQSWSKPTLTTIKYGAGTKKVLIFAGGYDTAQDGNPLNGDSLTDNDDTIGRAIFIVDAEYGTLLWSAGPSGSSADLTMSELTHSIPSEVRLLDSDLDGNTDRLYVGDMRGQIFRIDLQASTTGITGRGIRLASLGGSTEADNRRFYYPPDVVVTQRRGQAPYISVNIGSGYRAHPLNPLTTTGAAAPRVNDRFYSLRDPNVLGAAPSGFTTITTSSLFDATSSLVDNESDITSLAAANGWYITLGGGGSTSNGEKVLAPAMTINGEIFFTTYTPPASVARTDCAPPPGVGNLYRVSLFDAAPVRDDNNVSSHDTSAPTTADRVKTLDRPGIPSAPTAMFREDGNGNVGIVTCQGTECDPLPSAIQMQETYWRDGT